MMLPEVRVLLERANARRLSLLGLVAAIPHGYWSRVAPGDSWSARNHLEHVATADAFLEEVVSSVVRGSETWLAGTSDQPALLAARTEAMTRLAPLSLESIVATMDETRGSLARQLARLDRTHLLGPVFIAGNVSAWGDRVPVALSSYLAAWAAHDSIHEATVREAVSTPPDLVAVAMARRLR
jgi:hypothetical protein